MEKLKNLIDFESSLIIIILKKILENFGPQYIKGVTLNTNDEMTIESVKNDLVTETNSNNYFTNIKLDLNTNNGLIDKSSDQSYKYLLKIIEFAKENIKNPNVNYIYSAKIMLLILKIKQKWGKNVKKSKMLKDLSKLINDKVNSKIYLVYLINERKNIIFIQKELIEFMNTL